MRKTRQSAIRNAVVAVLLGGMAIGCGSTVRAVTHIGAYGPKDKPYLYIGYAENKDVSRVRKCTVNPDNSIACEEQEGVNTLLNAE